MRRCVLVTGFGPFLNVVDNPTEHLARAVDGRVVDGAMIIGEVLPVEYAEGPRRAARLARALDAQLVLGLGVARERHGVQVEAFGRRVCGGIADNAGHAITDLGEGPDRVPASLDVRRLGEVFDGISEDAGGFVCNAWAWHVPRHVTAPAAFVHVPPGGMGVDRLLTAIATMIS